MTTTTTPRVWLITGASSGLGHELATAALRAGDAVAATARDPRTLADLHALAPDRVEPLALDLTRLDDVPRVVDAAIARFGRIDVLVNNAGHGVVGAVEEVEPEQLREIMEVLFFGPIAMARAVLPHMRARAAGTIVAMSSIAGQIGFPGMSAYSAAKFALEGTSEALAAEVAEFGVRVVIAELGGFRTAFQGPRLHRSSVLDAYATTAAGTMRAAVEATHGAQPGDPAKAAAAILRALDTPDLPLRLAVGDDAVVALRAKHARLAADLEQVAHLGVGTSFPGEGWAPERLASMGVDSSDDVDALATDG